MVPTPIALGLTICEQVIVEQGTLNVSLIGNFTTFRANQFPYFPRPFCIFASLSGGKGEAEITLTITEIASDEEIQVQTRRLVFPDRFTEVHLLFRLAECEFPSPGAYIVYLTCR